MKHLRGKFSRELPQEWEKVTNNGSFAYASPLLITARNIEEGRYAMKVRQAYLHGWPYDPYTGDRTLKSWVFECLMFFPLVPFVWLAGGDIHRGWVFAHAFFGTAWVFSFFLMLRRFTKHEASALLAAAGLFFLNDTLRSVVSLPDIPFSAWPRWLFLTAAYAAGQVQWIRLPTPGMTALCAFWVLAGIYAIMRAPRPRPILAVLLGAAAGLLCFSHSYEWMLSCGALMFLFLLSPVFGLERAARLNLGVAAAVSAAVSGGYYLFASGMTKDVLADIIDRVGRHGRFFYRMSGYYLLWGAFFFWKARKEKEEPIRPLWLILACCLTAVVAASNLSLATGYDLQFYGHMTRLGTLCILLGLFGLWLRGGWGREWTGRHAAVLLAALFAGVFFREKAWSDTHYKIFGIPKTMEEAMRWMDASLPEDRLVLSVSGAVNEQLPLESHSRCLVAPGSPTYSSPHSTEELLRGLAGTLKAADADLEGFFRDRWEQALVRDTLKQQTAYFTRNVSWEALEQSSWPMFVFDVQGFQEDAVRGYEPRIRRYYEEAAAPSKPYYLWVGTLDRPYLRSDPQKRGGKLVYRNPDVALYEFR